MLRSRIYFPYLNLISVCESIEDMLSHILDSGLMGDSTTVDSDVRLPKRIKAKMKIRKNIFSEPYNKLKSIISGSSLQNVSNTVALISDNIRLVRASKN